MDADEAYDAFFIFPPNFIDFFPRCEVESGEWLIKQENLRAVPVGAGLGYEQTHLLTVAF